MMMFKHNKPAMMPSPSRRASSTTSASRRMRHSYTLHYNWSLSSSSTLMLLLTIISLLLIPQAASQSNSYNQNTVRCNTGSSTESAYDSLEALQTDLDNERSRILAGTKQAEGSYQFVLCAQTQFTLSSGANGFGPLRPVLNNIQIFCGLPPRVSSQCVFYGNNVQIDVPDLSATPHPVNVVSLTGVTFSKFTEAAIFGAAPASTRVLIINSEFSDFSSAFIVSQRSNSGSGNPFRVEVRRANIKNGVAAMGFYVVGSSTTGGSGSDDDNNVLLLQELEVVDTDLTGSLMSITGDVSASLEDSTVTSCDMKQVVSAQGGANVSVADLQVSSMKQLQVGVQVTGTGTTATLSQLTLQDNVNQDLPSWQYMEVNEKATALIADSVLTGNQNVRYGFYVHALSSLDIRDVRVSNNRGALGGTDDPNLVSVVVLANVDSMVRIFDSEFSNTDFITSALFAFGDSKIEVRRTCFSELSTDGALMFAQFGSSLNVREHNAIVNTAVLDEPLFCAQGGARVVEESLSDSTCFKDGLNTNTGAGCSFDCVGGVTYNDCSDIPDKSETDAPTTIAPTTSPMPTAVPSSGICRYGTFATIIWVMISLFVTTSSFV